MMVVLHLQIKCQTSILFIHNLQCMNIITNMWLLVEATIIVVNVYQGSSDITQRNNRRQLDDIFSEEIVKIEKDGEKKEIKLKKQKKSSVF